MPLTVPNQLNVVRRYGARLLTGVSRLRLPAWSSGELTLSSGWGRTLLWAIVVAGVAVRLRLYAADRSLWADEAWLALNIVGRSFGELALPLDDNQVAPLLYLWFTKAVTLAFGTGEYALRLPSLLTSVGTLLLFVPIAGRLLRPTGMLVATGIVAFNIQLLFYTMSAKQYACEAFGVLLVVGAFVRYREARDRRGLALLMAAGVVSPWLSYGAVLTVAAVSLTMAASALLGGDRTELKRLAWVGAPWAVSLGALYALILRAASSNEYLRLFWQNSFLPFPPEDFLLVRWLPRTLLGILEQHYTETALGLAASLMLMGAFVLWRQRRELLGVLIGPLLVALGLSALELFPIQGRLLLFMIPPSALVMGIGFQALHRHLSPQARPLLLLPLCVLFFEQVWYSARSIPRPEPSTQEVRPVIAELKARLQPNDVVYVHWPLAPTLKHYVLTTGEELPGLVWGTDLMELALRSPQESLSYLEQDVRDLPGESRVWLLMDSAIVDQELGVLDRAMQRRAKVLETITRPGVTLRLYEVQG